MAPKGAKAKAKAEAKAKAKVSEPKKGKKGKAADELSMDEFARICDESAKDDETYRPPEPFPKPSVGEGTNTERYVTVTDERDGKLLAVIPPSGELRMVLDVDDTSLRTRKAEPDETITCSKPSANANAAETNSAYAVQLLKTFAVVPDPPKTRETTGANAAQWDTHIDVLTFAIRGINAGNVVVFNAFNRGLAGAPGEELKTKIFQRASLWRPDGVFSQCALKEGANRAKIDLLRTEIDTFTSTGEPGVKPPLEGIHREMVEMVVQDDKKREKQTGVRDFIETFVRMWNNRDNAVEILKSYMEPERRLAKELGVGHEVEKLMPELAAAHLAGNILDVKYYKTLIDDIIAHPEDCDERVLFMRPRNIKLNGEGYYATCSPIDGTKEVLAGAYHWDSCNCDDCSISRRLQDLDEGDASNDETFSTDKTIVVDETVSHNATASEDPVWTKWVQSYKSPREPPFMVFYGDDQREEKQPEGKQALEQSSETPINAKMPQKKNKRKTKKRKRSDNRSSTAAEVNLEIADEDQDSAAVAPPDPSTPIETPPLVEDKPCTPSNEDDLEFAETLVQLSNADDDSQEIQESEETRAHLSSVDDDSQDVQESEETRAQLSSAEDDSQEIEESEDIQEAQESEETLMPRIMPASQIHGITGHNPGAQGLRKVFYFKKGHVERDASSQSQPKLVKAVKDRELNLFVLAEWDSSSLNLRNLGKCVQGRRPNFLADTEDTRSLSSHTETDAQDPPVVNGGDDEVQEPWVEEQKTLEQAPTTGSDVASGETEHFARPFKEADSLSPELQETSCKYPPRNSPVDEMPPPREAPAAMSTRVSTASHPDDLSAAISAMVQTELEKHLQPLVAKIEALNGRVAYLEAFNSKFQHTTETMTQMKFIFDDLLQVSKGTGRSLLVPDEDSPE